ncbi:tol-pal system-associated acyl-CoA thioesterase [Pararobbsia alpina]|uniref:1,4-dihydroxy-2-naphthoyl-CoA hydrolase n=1 Tax=Pararobbsia alpina TaxID=621374 RepID=A0A6S7CCS2_9BURK|nr:tol-pal system-associated acyl-CoA thioesterase [Pararobbsia alpina]CAB3786473.1 1,4-dihydroxy-2-naphthoyl-CoA hydrolase [Pararobbsia alpina]
MNSIAQSAARPDAFVWRIRVYFEDTDMGGIVFYANYLKYFERARTEWLRACGVSQRALTEASGTMFVVRGTALDYHAPARLDDWLEITTRVGRIGRASVDFEQQAWCEGKLLAGGTIRVGCVDRTTMKPAAIPSDTFAALNVGPSMGPPDDDPPDGEPSRGPLVAARQD